MPSGGVRENSGAKKGVPRMSTRAQAAHRLEAKRGNHILPHQILLKAANGESFLQRRLTILYYGRGPQKGQEKRREWIEEIYWPSYADQIDAAKAAGAFYAPRLASQTIDAGKDTTKAFREVIKQLGSKLPG